MKSNNWTKKYQSSHRYIKYSKYKVKYYEQSTLLLFYFICHFVNKMPVIFESDEDKYYDKVDIKKYKKGSQSGIESRGSGIFLNGTKNGFGLYLPTRSQSDYGEGIVDAIINAGKTVIETLANNAGTIGQAANAVGSVANATSNIADAVKSIKEANRPLTMEKVKSDMEKIKSKLPPLTEERKKELEEMRSLMTGRGFKVS